MVYFHLFAHFQIHISFFLLVVRGYRRYVNFSSEAGEFNFWHRGAIYTFIVTENVIKVRCSWRIILSSPEALKTLFISSERFDHASSKNSLKITVEQFPDILDALCF